MSFLGIPKTVKDVQSKRSLNRYVPHSPQVEKHVTKPNAAANASVDRAQK
ncbi:hypothetical protein [Chenggangzhangella methanolivorans]|uniref:Uncharacterized protein n=1 Tax=Chenggangzhangella methanolivorans TaxID=1437009 RepID=A0A9E6R9M1_9HYPH|nr:hypothetical protein [Chenggangzhangella methanolivorans]QZO00659.1 hypothetical protein K6K41_02795 [Chenggangzhangella methanolivorans]